ncbi:UvrD-helicase-domain-containing protein [Xylariaceae sp. FL0804]|nr:UvrD-helicase-domain-containing protein [Xylariaceae sp. FL0804]
MALTRDDALFTSLNKAQCRAVSSEAPTVAILAGPGSGKTHTLTSRVVWLIEHLGIRPCDVIVATFTVKASNEMKSRIGKALGDGREKKIVLGTFHSIARRYLAAYGQRIGLDPKFGIADDSDSRGAITRICKRLQAPIEPAVARAWISKRKARGTSDERRVKAKNGQDIESQTLEQCYQEYQSHLERSNLLDYDDLLVRCVELLRKFPRCVSNIQTVLIDEYQDTNGVQYDLMKLFAQAHRRITIVGDPDQSIYGWRSAEIKNLHRLLRDFPGTDEISLEENYRSSSSILHTSLKVIQQDQDRYKKALLPVHEKGTRPVLRKLKTSQDEADWIISEIKRIKLLSGNMVDCDDFAILLRSASVSRRIEAALGREGIPYRMVGGFKFYDREEIKILLDYLRIIHQLDNNDALARVMNVPKRGIGDVTIKSLLEEAERGSMSLWTLLDKHCKGDRNAKTNIRKQTEQKISGELLRPITDLRDRLRTADGSPTNIVDVIQQLVQKLHLEDYLQAKYGPEYEPRWANVQEFVNLAEEFAHQAQLDEEALPTVDGAQQVASDDVLARFLANVSLASDKQTEDNGEGKPLVTVSTIHAAKGLEWPVVFIPAVYKGMIPHRRSDDLDEERRLLYVAMTRAKALLYLSAPSLAEQGASGGGGVELSPFVEDLASAFLCRGPSLDRPVMAGVAKILGRTLPPDDVIYRGMPAMAAPEDNLFPVDPSQIGQASAAAGVLPPTTRPGGPGHGGFAPPGKRQKTMQQQHPQVAGESVEGWNAPYRTTMDKAGSFTVPTTGFTTAGAHYASASAAVAAAARQQVQSQPPAAAPGSKKRPAAAAAAAVSRPPAQRSLLGYGYGYGVADHDGSRPRPPREATVDDDDDAPPRFAVPASAPYARRGRAPPPPPVHRGPRRLPPQPQPQPQPAIDPALAAHRLRVGAVTKTVTGRPAAVSAAAAAPPSRIRDDDDGVPPSAARAYACFSSSPPRPGAGEEEEGDGADGKNGEKGKEQNKNSDGESGKENVAPSSSVPTTRPAASFHATTVRASLGGWRGGGGGGGGGIRRPAGLARGGITPVEKLNKPYKLTVKRP